MLGLTYEAMLRYGDAERSYRRAVALAGGQYRPYFAYGVFLFRQGRAGESLPLLERAVALDPGAAEARFELGRVLLHLGRLERAEAETRKAVELGGECRYRYQLA
ncbi:MAG: hypothetical protein DMG07_19280, partial [Acidobacteria bacterium]